MKRIRTSRLPVIAGLALVALWFGSPASGTGGQSVDNGTADSEPVAHVADDPRPPDARSPILRDAFASAGDPGCRTGMDDRGQFEVCVRAEEPSAAADASLGRLATDAAGRTLVTGSELPYPSWCLQAVTGAYLGTDRTNACGAFSSTLEVARNVDGVRTVVGQLHYTWISWVYTAPQMLTWAHQFTLTPYAGWGEGLGWTMNGQGTSWCGAKCSLTETSFTPAAAAVGARQTGQAYFQSESLASGELKLNVGDWQFWFTKTGLSSTTGYTNSPTVRCDNALSGSSAGCVLPDWNAGIIYSGAQLPEFTAHVSQAQASGLPGSRGNPLTRTTNESYIALNRAAACPTGVAWLPRPAGKSCDEYPFASTNQGAALAGGTARTFPWCGVTLQGPASTGATGFSICMIDEAENTLAGSQLQTVGFAPQRVLSGDKIFVEVS